MNKNYTEEIKILTQLGSDASQAALAEYTRYFIIASIWWAIVWLACAGVMVWLWKYCAKLHDENDNTVLYIMRTLVAVLALVFVIAFANNISDLLTPRAMAIHQLLKDVRGS